MVLRVVSFSVDGVKVAKLAIVRTIILAKGHLCFFTVPTNPEASPCRNRRHDGKVCESALGSSDIIFAKLLRLFVFLRL